MNPVVSMAQSGVKIDCDSSVRSDDFVRGARRRAIVTDAIIRHVGTPAMSTIYLQEIAAILSERNHVGGGQNHGMRRKPGPTDESIEQALAEGRGLPAVFKNPLGRKESLVVVGGATNNSIRRRVLAGGQYANMAGEGGEGVVSGALFAYDMSSPLMMAMQVDPSDGISLLDAVVINRFVVCRDIAMRSYLYQSMIGVTIPVAQAEVFATVSGIMILSRVFGGRGIELLASAWCVYNNINKISIFNEPHTAASAKFLYWHISKYKASHANICEETIPFAAAIIAKVFLDSFGAIECGSCEDYERIADLINDEMRSRNIPAFTNSMAHGPVIAQLGKFNPQNLEGEINEK